MNKPAYQLQPGDRINFVSGQCENFKGNQTLPITDTVSTIDNGVDAVKVTTTTGNILTLSHTAKVNLAEDNRGLADNRYALPVARTRPETFRGISIE